jgi:hypothetical protein
MSADSPPCRNCGAVTGNPVIIYGRDAVGALVPKAAKCRGRCLVRQPDRQAGPSPGTVVTAFRPGKCAGCTWDIVPGDKIMHDGEGGFFHYECAPAEDPPVRVRRRERATARLA